MPERDQGDHWDFLAADLGTAPTPKEETKPEEQAPPAAEAEVVEVVEEPAVDEPVAAEREEPEQTTENRGRGRSGDRVVSGFGYRRGAVDWANLARELGVEAMEEAPEPIPAADSDGADLETVTAELVEPVEEEVFEGERLSNTVAEDELPEEDIQPVANSTPAPTGAGFGVGILDGLQSEPKSEATEEAVLDVEEQQEERKGRRRRRRRKPRRQEQEKSDVADAEPVVVEQAESEISSQEEISAEEKTPEEKTREGGEGRSRRRGRRRGGGKRSARDQREAKSDEFGVGLDADGVTDSAEFEVFDAEDVEDADDVDDLLEMDEEDSGSGRSEDQDHGRRPSKKVSHRGIPSWDEAVGHIIDTNMEGRSKKPDSGGSRQRPGRRRGGDRSGNRGRS